MNADTPAPRSATMRTIGSDGCGAKGTTKSRADTGRSSACVATNETVICAIAICAPTLDPHLPAEGTEMEGTHGRRNRDLREQELADTRRGYLRYADRSVYASHALR